MASSKSTFQSLIQSVRHAAASLLAPRETAVNHPAPPSRGEAIVVPAVSRPRAVRAQAQRAPVQRVPRSPVRVLRVAEAGSRRVAGARMVISGRLADVCAELERLAALEAAAT